MSGQTTSQIQKPSWALGDFDYNGLVDDDDVTLLGVFYQPTPPAAVAPSSIRRHLAKTFSRVLSQPSYGRLLRRLLRIRNERRPSLIWLRSTLSQPRASNSPTTNELPGGIPGAGPNGPPVSTQVLNQCTMPSASTARDYSTSWRKRLHISGRWLSENTLVTRTFRPPAELTAMVCGPHWFRNYAERLAPDRRFHAFLYSQVRAYSAGISHKGSLRPSLVR